MRRLGLALRVFWRILTGSVPVEHVERWLSETVAASDQPAATSLDARSATAAAPAAAPAASDGAVRATPRATPRRSDAITLLAALQREARFVDLVQESLGQYSDAQIGAAARDVLRGCREVLDRMFALQPVLPGDENEIVETPTPLAGGRLRIVGSATGEPPFRGRLVHHGWEATRCELPSWSGDEKSEHVVAPAEIEC